MISTGDHRSLSLSLLSFALLSATYMVSSVVKEASGLFTVSSTLYLRPKKEDKNAKFHCTVEYSMPNDEIDQQNSESFSLNLLCESRGSHQLSEAPSNIADSLSLQQSGRTEWAPSYWY